MCWAPFHAQRLVAIYLPTETDFEHANSNFHNIYIIVTYVSGVLFYLSTCVNPLLYSIMSHKFRAAFKVRQEVLLFPPPLSFNSSADCAFQKTLGGSGLCLHDTEQQQHQETGQRRRRWRRIQSSEEERLQGTRQSEINEFYGCSGNSQLFLFRAGTEINWKTVLVSSFAID